MLKFKWLALVCLFSLTQTAFSQDPLNEGEGTALTNLSAAFTELDEKYAMLLDLDGAQYRGAITQNALIGLRQGSAVDRALVERMRLFYVRTLRIDPRAINQYTLEVLYNQGQLRRAARATVTQNLQYMRTNPQDLWLVDIRSRNTLTFLTRYVREVRALQEQAKFDAAFMTGIEDLEQAIQTAKRSLVFFYKDYSAPQLQQGGQGLHQQWFTEFNREWRTKQPALGIYQNQNNQTIYLAEPIPQPPAAPGAITGQRGSAPPPVEIRRPRPRAQQPAQVDDVDPEIRGGSAENDDFY